MNIYTQAQADADIAELRRRLAKASEPYRATLERWIAETQAQVTEARADPFAPTAWPSRTIELSDTDSHRWNGPGKWGQAARLEILGREQERANRLGVPVEVFHINGKPLALFKPGESADIIKMAGDAMPARQRRRSLQ